MGPKAPTATPTAPSFETPYLETILPDGAARSLLAAAFPSRERLRSHTLLSSPLRLLLLLLPASHSRLTLASAEILPLLSARPRSVVRDDPTPSTRLDEVCLRNGKCGNKTNSRPSSQSVVAPPLDASGPPRKLPTVARKRWRGDDSFFFVASSHTRVTTTSTVTVRPCCCYCFFFFLAKRACTPRARPVNSSIVGNGAPWCDRAHVYSSTRSTLLNLRRPRRMMALVVALPPPASGIKHRRASDCPARRESSKNSPPRKGD